MLVVMVETLLSTAGACAGRLELQLELLELAAAHDGGVKSSKNNDDARLKYKNCAQP